jgi:hypothetical protein
MQKVIEHAGLTPANAAVIGACVAGAWAVNAWFLGRKSDAESSGVGAKAALEARSH